jgi:peptidoglycan hydrolase-like protein with peptidoglycan-binding domain
MPFIGPAGRIRRFRQRPTRRQNPAAFDLHALGDTGADDRALTVDGRDGPDTRAAATAFQRDHDLLADGIAGHHTLAALNDATQARPPSKAAASTLPDHALTTARNLLEHRRRRRANLGCRSQLD